MEDACLPIFIIPKMSVFFEKLQQASGFKSRFYLFIIL